MGREKNRQEKPMQPPISIPCGLCLREFPRKKLTKHHCLPKSKGGTTDDIELLCGQCHGMIHATYENNTLARQLASLVELRVAPELQPFLAWVRKQPATSRSKNIRRKRRL
jgi:hypothetical protein